MRRVCAHFVRHMQKERKTDMLFSEVTVIQADGGRLSGAYVGIRDGRIAYLGTQRPAEDWGEEVRGELLLIPGLYNSHTHVPMTLLRGYGDDMVLDRWLNDRIFPFEDQLTGEDVYWGSLLGIAEMLASGTVSFTDMYYFCDRIVQAVEESGIKANIGRGTSCFDPGKKFRDLPACADTLELLRTVHGTAEGRIRVDVSPHSEYTTRPDILADMAALAAEYGVRMHTHLSETRKEQLECVARHGMTPAAVMQAAGVLDQPVTLAHCVWLTEPDMERLAAAPDLTVAHCVKSNLKLASGVAPVDKLRKKGIRVALGTDSAASNNALDMLEEMRTAALTAKGVSLDPCVLSAPEVLSMATREGALSQGRGDCGDIKEGFRADIVALRMDTIAMTPVHSPVSNLIYAAGRDAVAMTVVDGRVLYREGEFPTIDIERVRYEAGRRALDIARRTEVRRV